MGLEPLRELVAYLFVFVICVYVVCVILLFMFTLFVMLLEPLRELPRPGPRAEDAGPVDGGAYYNYYNDKYYNIVLNYIQQMFLFRRVNTPLSSLQKKYTQWSLRGAESNH